MPKPRKIDMEIMEKMKNAGVKKKFVRYKEGAQLYSMGLHTFQTLAKEANAVRKIKRIALVNTEILDAYIDAIGSIDE